MGTCEEGIPPLEIEAKNEINLGTSSNGIHHDVSVVERDVDDQDGDQTQNQESPAIEETAIVEQFQSLELQSTVNDVREVVEVEVEVEAAEEEEEEEEEKTHNYPLRLNAADCSFYLKTGTCKYGLNCRFNHPSKRVFRPLGEKKEQEKNSEEECNGVVSDTGKTECKYFSTSGGCKYGDACRYIHSSEKIEKTNLELNFLGLPMRPMEKECTFYLRTGTCAYGANCRFNHPDPTAANEPGLGNSLDKNYSLRGDNQFSKSNEPMHSSGALPSSLSNGTNLQNSVPYASNMNSYHQVMAQNQGTVSMSSNNFPLPHQIMNLSKKTDPSTDYERQIQNEEFPERPGLPDCDYFLKTGDCKYRSSCRYNHPIRQTSRLQLPPLFSKGLYPKTAKVSPVETMELHDSNAVNERRNGTRSDNHQKMQNGGFPERPGMQECEYFMKTGNCKYNSACRYHHPRNRVPTPAPYALNEKGLPLRSGAKVCRNYERQGTCQYGHKCLFLHPDNLSSAVPVHAEDDDLSSSNVAVATDTALPAENCSAENNAMSDWGDGWVL